MFELKMERVASTCHCEVVFDSPCPIPLWLQLWAVLHQVVPQLADPVFVLLFVAYNVAVHGAILYVNFHYGLSFYPASILTTDQVMGRPHSCHTVTISVTLIHSCH